MNKVSPLALANAFGLFVFILHPIFHIWCAVSPQSYTYMVHIFFPGIIPQVTAFDYSIKITILAVLTKAAVFWGIGYCIGALYNITPFKNK